MKRLFLAALAGLTIFAGCKKDDDEGIKTQSEFTIAEGDSFDMIVGEILQLHATHLASESPSKNYEWQSSNKSVASVTVWGEVKAVGETIITVKTDNDITAECRIVVSAIAITQIKLKSTDYEIAIGDSMQLTPDVLPANATYKADLVYTSTDEAVATVGDDGKVKTVSVGECQIKIESPEGKEAVCNIKVLLKKVTNISLVKNDLDNVLTIEQGETYKFKVEIEPKTDIDATINWISSDESVATISEDGTVTAVGIGECTITVISSNTNVKTNCIVKVIPSPVKGIELDKTSVTILIGSTDIVTANVIPDIAANKNVIWTSSDETIAIVDNGTITGIAAGTATITATTEEGGFKRSCKVTVGAINIFMSASYIGGMEQQDGNNVFYCSCSISNNSSVGVYVKSVSIDGDIKTINETVESNASLTKSFVTNVMGSSISSFTTQYDVKWTIEYDGVEYEVAAE